MSLKWVSALLTATSLGAFAAANVVNEGLPIWINLALVAVCAVGAIVVVAADLHQRLDSRLSAVTDFLVTSLDEITGRLHDLDARAEMEAIVTSREGTIVPMASRVARSRRAPTDG